MPVYCMIQYPYVHRKQIQSTFRLRGDVLLGSDLEKGFIKIRTYRQ